MTRNLLLAAVSAAALLPHPAHAQSMEGMAHDTPVPATTPAPAQHQSDGMTMPMDGVAMGHGGPDAPAPAVNAVAGSGTSLLPADGNAMHGLHAMAGGWMLMAHGYALVGYTNQSGPRGDDGVVASTMAMLSAERDLGAAHLTLRSMFSIDALLGPRGYPDLFAAGETAHRQPLVDRQHPHDAFMELAARIDMPLGGGVTGFLYGGPVGEPALGPSAFVHRPSAQYLPLAPISHHWFDSTHISFGVVTAGVTTGSFQLEGSGFRGREPDENRWDIETPGIDSWSARATWTPSPHWAVQLSHGWLDQPEVAHPGENEARTTVTVHYAGGGVSAMLGWAEKQRMPGPALSALIGEVNWDLSAHHSLFGRVENIANDELFPDEASPLHDVKFRVSRFEGGYAWRTPITRHAELALGGSLAAYARPAALAAAYGDPFGYTLFTKLTLGR